MQLPEQRNVVQMLQHVLGADLRELAVGERKREVAQIMDDVYARQARLIEVDPSRANVRPAAQIQAAWRGSTGSGRD